MENDTNFSEMLQRTLPSFEFSNIVLSLLWLKLNFWVPKRLFTSNMHVKKYILSTQTQKAPHQIDFQRFQVARRC